MQRIEGDDPVVPAELGRRDVVDELDERLAEEQRNDREVAADQTSGRPADRQPEARREDHHERDREVRRPVDPVRRVQPVGREQCVPVGAEAVEGDVAEVEQPGPPHRHVQPQGEDGQEQRVDPDLKLERVQPDRPA